MNTSPAVSASSPFDNPSRFGGRAPDLAGASSAPESPFDSQPMLALHDKLTSWYDAEWNRQASNRFQQALDEDFYDGMQWTQEDAQALIERGQAPLVFNEVKPTIDWIIGTERRGTELRVGDDRCRQRQRGAVRVALGVSIDPIADARHVRTTGAVRGFPQSGCAPSRWRSG